MKTLILFGCASLRQGPRAIAQAKRTGLHPVLIDTADNITFFNAGYDQIVEQHVVNEKSYNEAYLIINELAESHDLAAIYTFEEYSVEICAKLSYAFSLPSSSPESVRLVRDKSLCRNCLREAGMLQPLSTRVTSFEEATLFMKKSATDSCIIKPIDAAGSQGVSRIERDSEEQLSLAIALLLPEQQKNFLIEEFISGDEYSIEGFFHQEQPIFLGITSKFLFPGDSFVENMHVFPAKLSLSLQKNILQHVKCALDATQLTVGHFHVECWLQDETVIIGEIHNRPGGDYIHLLTEIATGIETYTSVFKQFNSLSITDVTSSGHIYNVGIRYFHASPGKLSSITGIDEVNEHPNVILTEINVEKDDHINLITQSSQRVGCMVAKHNSADALLELLDWGTTRVKFEVD
ncbi:hypothetical protein BN439_2920 [Erwinia amylovora Ea644]|uniref:ATP-grasp domain-containing protein n=1 Tax=Erwinia amylovora TaxID=552 RepID=UPI0002CCC1C3|nr:ATP-grasp domain-containing protein [Erwinia amylovora]CCP03957.1 hypothetical protein BN439_2920 [Erwinia amylovora Ea644]CCP08019.1 hypothetical protein BN440_3013 [Erwinia amylovora MR1]